jgi:hypothetical protein
VTALQVQDVYIRVKRQFGDESGAQITDADLLRWINDAQREVIKQNEDVLQTTVTANSVVDQSEYSLPANFYKLQFLKYKGYALRPLSPQEFHLYLDGYESPDNVYASGTPTVYMVWGGAFTVFPKPDTSITAGFKLYYTRRPVDVAADLDTIDLPEEYHEAVVNIVLQKAYELDEDWTGAGNKSSQVQSDLNILKQAKSFEDQEVYPHVTVALDDLW